MIALDYDAWLEQTEPVGFDLLRLMPWQWDRLLRRRSVVDVEAMIASVLHERRAQAALAIIANAGTSAESTLAEAVDRYVRDPRFPRERPAERDLDAELVEAAVAQARALEAAGFAKTGRLTPEELAEAQAGARAR